MSYGNKTTVSQTIAKEGKTHQMCHSHHSTNRLLGKDIPSFSSVEVIRKIEVTFRKKRRVLTIGQSK